MRASIGLTVLVAGPVLGSLVVLLMGRTRSWQVIAGAVAGQILGYAALRLWSSYVSRQLLTGRQETLVASLPHQSWSDQVIPMAALVAFAVAVGGLALLARRLALLALLALLVRP